MPTTDASAATRELDERFLELHHRKETAFWNTRMGIADESDALARAELEMKDFLGDGAALERLRSLAETSGNGDDAVLTGWIRTFERNAIQTREGRSLYAENVEAEQALIRARRDMDLGYVDPSTGERTPASSVALANGLNNGETDAYRRACHAALQSIETFVLANGFPEIIELRNRFARAEGHADFYEYRVRMSEGFGKDTLFALLDDLEHRTRDKAGRELDALAQRLGDEAVLPWNLNYHAGGSLAAEREPYVRFEDALWRWVRTFSFLGIRYAAARLTLDLVERTGKYENGFMHGPRPAYVRNGRLVPAIINFTANAIPNRVGSGQRACQTLFHEGGHAAHFANIRQGSPCFAHEFAPMSGSMAETQSMFADSVLGDADWHARYARNAEGEALPFELTEKSIRTSRPFQAQQIRSMLAICYAEKAMYDLGPGEASAERILDIARDVERRLVQTPGGAPRPILSVPHLLSWESSAYYHGYVLAQMAVRQTRHHFFDAYGYIVDNPRVGADLTRIYWAPGSSRSFLDLVQELTGTSLTADALVADATFDTERAVDRARERIARLEQVPLPGGPPDLDVRLRIVHGSEVIVEEGAPLREAAEAYAAWVSARWPREESA